jgi:hypothetical protein
MIQEYKYPIDVLPFTLHKGQEKHAKFDSDGVLQSRVRYRSDFVYHATAIASYAITTDDPDSFFDQIIWLEQNMDKDGAIWHNFNIVSYINVENPWVGGLAQGLTISALIKAYTLTDNKSYLTSAKQALNGLIKHTLYCDDKNNIWICEYPGIHSILNGFIYSLFGVIDINKYSPSNSSKDLIVECISTINNNLKQYDLGNWSRYDLIYRYPCDLFYNNVHALQMKALHSMFNDIMYLDYFYKWYHEKDSFYYRTKKQIMQISQNGVFEMYKRWKQYNTWMKQKGEYLA